MVTTIVRWFLAPLLVCAALPVSAADFLCGDANGDGKITAPDALFALKTAVGTGDCALVVCDYTGDEKITASDALAILRKAVGQPVVPKCPEPNFGEVLCDVLTPPASGTCEVTTGDAKLVLAGDVLTPGTIFRGGRVVVDADGMIVHAGCIEDCSSSEDCVAALEGATVVTCAEAVISPGLINAHEHVTFSLNPPYVGTAERYEHRHDWRTGKNQHTIIPAMSAGGADSVSWVELRHLLSGTTSMVGSGGRPGLVRNLDSTANQEGLGQSLARFDTFPLDDSNGNSAVAPSCSYGASPVTPEEIEDAAAYLPHVAEGIDARAVNEAVCLGDFHPETDVTLGNVAFMEAIGLSADEYALLGERGTGIVWSPRSNIFLYGNTTVVTAAERLGINIALGTDWSITGSMNMLRELRCADSFDETYLGDHFSDEDLWRMATLNAAVETATDDVIGSLAAGKVADISVFRRGDNDGHRAVIDAEAEDVVLVLRGGKAIYGDAALLTAIKDTGACDTVNVCEVSKKLCLSAEMGKTYAQLEAAVGLSAYDAFFCEDTPPNEPTCTPSRGAVVSGSTTYTGTTSGADTDGDGIANGADNCPTVFNPVRPMDGGAQADDDGDDEGDACDPCPLLADTLSCP